MKKQVIAVITAAVMSAGVFFMTGVSTKAEDGATALSEMQAEEAAETEEKTEGDWRYSVLEDGTAEITGYDGEATKIEIPGEVGGAKVTRIGHRANIAFSSCNELTEISIPDGVTSIEGYAFSNCSGLKKLMIPESVTSIGANAFDGTPWLESEREKNPIVVVNGIVIDAQTASGKVTIPEGVTVIGDMAFNNCNDLTEVIIPESVTSIGQMAFDFCTGLTEIRIPGSVTNIGGLAFDFCTGLTKITIEGATSIETSAFFRCSALTEVTIPESVTSIGYNAFAWCDALTDITIPKGVTSIGNRAFGYKYSGENDSNGYAIYDKVPDFTIYGYPDTAAEAYAKENGFTFIEIKDESEEKPTEAPTEKPTEAPSDAAITVETTGELASKLEMTNEEIFSAVSKVFTEEQLEAIRMGTTPLDIVFDITNIDGSISENDKELIGKAVENIPGNDKFNFKVMNYLDLKLGAIIDGKELAVSETEGMITVSVELEKPANGTYKVVRIHDGSTDVIDSQLSKDGARLTFKTDKFSTYAIVYSDVASGDSVPAGVIVMITLGVLTAAALLTVNKFKTVKA